METETTGLLAGSSSGGESATTNFSTISYPVPAYAPSADISSSNYQKSEEVLF